VPVPASCRIHPWLDRRRGIAKLSLSCPCHKGNHFWTAIGHPGWSKIFQGIIRGQDAESFLASPDFRLSLLHINVGFNRPIIPIFVLHKTK
jgi:hypothetical protein